MGFYVTWYFTILGQKSTSWSIPLKSVILGLETWFWAHSKARKILNNPLSQISDITSTDYMRALSVFFLTSGIFRNPDFFRKSDFSAKRLLKIRRAFEVSSPQITDFTGILRYTNLTDFYFFASYEKKLIFWDKLLISQICYNP